MTSIVQQSQCANAAKAQFDAIYDQPHPLDYFQALRQVGYRIPELAKPTFYRLFNNLRRLRSCSQLSVVDVGCSYGINAALLRYDLSLDALYRRYASPEISDLDAGALQRRDRAFYGSLPLAQALRLTGLDSAGGAVEYAEGVGLLDRGIECDLETDPFDPSQLTDLAETDVVISTGCIGYVTDVTYRRILAAVAGRSGPWVASFVLRMFPYDAIAATCADRGLITYKLTGRTFIQRRFLDRKEWAAVQAQLEARPLSVQGLEGAGHLHAEFYLSVPTGDARALDLQAPWEVVASP